MRKLWVAAFSLVSFLAPGAYGQEPLISTVAGGGPIGVSALAAGIGNPASIILDADGSLLIASGSYLNLILRVDSSGQMTVVAGNGGNGFSGDDGPSTAATLAAPYAIAFDAARCVGAPRGWCGAPARHETHEQVDQGHREEARVVCEALAPGNSNRAPSANISTASA